MEPYRDIRDLPPAWDIQRELGYVWEKSSFTVPKSVPDERVQAVAEKYMEKFGKFLESRGFQVIKMDRPQIDYTPLAEAMTDPDRRKYIIYSKVRRTPVIVRVDVPDEDVPIYLKSGYALA